MKLFLFSGVHSRITNRKLIEFSGVKDPVITYIPSSSKNIKSDLYFRQWKDTFVNIPNVKFNYFAIDRPYTQKENDKAFSSDIVYLSGGDTLLFWNNILEKNIDKELIKFAATGKVLSGLSAGAIILTPRLNILRIIEEKNKKTEKLALGLINFEFFPHYKSKLHKEMVVKYSHENNYPILCLPNKSAVMIENDVMKFIGKYLLLNRHFLEG